MTYKVVIIGCSKGGLRALQELFKDLPPDFPLPVIVVLHRARDKDADLDKYMAKSARLPVCSVEDKMPISASTIYSAPADYHVLIEGDSFALSTEQPVNYARPSIDVLLESAVDAYGDQVIAVILTGGNYDGARGAALVEKSGGLVIVQDPADAESKSMPEAAIAICRNPQIMPLGQIASVLSEICRLAGV